MATAVVDAKSVAAGRFSLGPPKPPSHERLGSQFSEVCSEDRNIKKIINMPSILNP
jgi:hypothetical protein